MQFICSVVDTSHQPYHTKTRHGMYASYALEQVAFILHTIAQRLTGLASSVMWIWPKFQEWSRYTQFNRRSDDLLSLFDEKLAEVLRTYPNTELQADTRERICNLVQVKFNNVERHLTQAQERFYSEADTNSEEVKVQNLRSGLKKRHEGLTLRKLKLDDLKRECLVFGMDLESILRERRKKLNEIQTNMDALRTQLRPLELSLNREKENWT